MISPHFAGRKGFGVFGHQPQGRRGIGRKPHHQRLETHVAVAARGITRGAVRRGCADGQAREQQQAARPAVAPGAGRAAEQPGVESVLRNDAPQGRGVQSVGDAGKSGDGLDEQQPGAGTADHRKPRRGAFAREQVKHHDTQVFRAQSGVAAALPPGAEFDRAEQRQQGERPGRRKHRIEHQKRFGHNCRFKALAIFVRNR